MRDGMAYAAEERVRAGDGSSVSWEGARLTTHFQPIYGVRRATCLGFEALARAANSSGGELDTEEFFARVDEATAACSTGPAARFTCAISPRSTRATAPFSS